MLFASGQMVSLWQRRHLKRLLKKDLAYLRRRLRNARIQTGNEAVVKGIVSDLRKLYTIDAKGTKIEDIPMMEGINRFEDFDFLFLDQRAILVRQSGCNLLLIQQVYP